MNKDTIEIIGNRIGDVRRAHKYTQDELAEKLEITPKHVSHVENGNATYSLEKLVQFCELCDCSLDYIINGNKQNKSLSKLPDEILEILEIGNEEEIDRLNRYLKIYVELLNK